MTQPIRFIHNTRNPRMTYTAAYSFEKTPSGDLNITYGIAQCNTKYDNFSRAAGRKLATARLEAARNGKSISAGRVPMFGTLTVKDAEGLSVGRLVSDHYENARKNVLIGNAACATAEAPVALVRFDLRR